MMKTTSRANSKANTAVLDGDFLNSSLQVAELIKKLKVILLCCLFSRTVLAQSAVPVAATGTLS
jgi:hypothetical protein